LGGCQDLNRTRRPAATQSGRRSTVPTEIGWPGSGAGQWLLDAGAAGRFPQVAPDRRGQRYAFNRPPVCVLGTALGPWLATSW